MSNYKNYRDYILDKLDERTLLEQLAEEASELSQAALKLIRAKGLNNNNTPVREQEAMLSLALEYMDLLMVYSMLQHSENVGEDVKKRIQEILRPNHMEKVAEVLGVKIGEIFSVRFGEYIDNQREFDGDCYLDDEGLHIVGQDRTQSVLLEKLLNGNAYIEREANNE